MKNARTSRPSSPSAPTSGVTDPSARDRWISSLGFLRPSRAAAVLTIIAAAGCAPTLNVAVLRPAQVNVRQYGGTITVVPFAGDTEGARTFTGDLIRRISQRGGGVVSHVPRGGAVIVQGTVTDYDAIETSHRQLVPCTRSHMAGMSQARSTTCTRYRREVRARVAVFFEVLVSATNERLATMTLTDEMVRSTQSEYGSPSAIDRWEMLDRLRARIIARFARVILPWRQTVRVRLGRCGEARDRCAEGIEALRAGAFERAADIFELAVRQLRRSGEPDHEHLADAYWNLGLAREFAGDFQAATRAIRRARRLAPDDRDYRRELRNIERLRAEREELIRQGGSR